MRSQPNEIPENSLARLTPLEETEIEYMSALRKRDLRLLDGHEIRQIPTSIEVGFG